MKSHLLEALTQARHYIFSRVWRDDPEHKQAQGICDLLTVQIVMITPDDPVETITAEDVLGEILLHAKSPNVQRPRTLLMTPEQRMEARTTAREAVESWRKEEILFRTRRDERAAGVPSS